MTECTFELSDAFSFSFRFDGNANPDFDKKMQTFFERIHPYCGYLENYKIEISSANTFPHSSGIASSASSYAALAMNIVQLEAAITGNGIETLINKASFLARLGSGSACRSIIPELAIWGAYTQLGVDEYALPLASINEVFKSYQDTILIVEAGKKAVSSTQGHALLEGNPYRSARIEQANTNTARLLNVLKDGNLIEFCELIESEALSLHAMMMTSTPSYLLMKPNTLEIIQKIRAFREGTGHPVCFTLDAGANVHMLFPASIEAEVKSFTEDSLIAYCENHQYLCDRVGPGPLALTEAHA